MVDTHEVINQVPPLVGYNPATSPALSEALVREGGGWGADEVAALGADRRNGAGADVGVSSRTAMNRCCGPTIGTDIASTRSNTTPPTTS